MLKQCAIVPRHSSVILLGLGAVSSITLLGMVFGALISAPNVAAAPPAAPPAAPTNITVACPAPPAPAPLGEPLPAFETDIRLAHSHYEIDRALVTRTLENFAALAREARIVPSSHAGRTNGFKLYAIRPGSLFARLGFLNGDLIERINGQDITSPDKALETYTRLRQATSLAVSLSRRGAPVTLAFTIR